MCEDIIRVLGNTTISLRKENEDMQQHILELEKAIELQNENISTLKTKLKHPVSSDVCSSDLNQIKTSCKNSFPKGC